MASKNIFLDIIKALSKSWLLPLPAILMLMWILYSSTDIWSYSEIIYDNQGNPTSSIVAENVILAATILTIFYLLTYTEIWKQLTGIPFWSLRSGYYEPTEGEVSVITTFFRLGLLIIIYAGTYGLMQKY